MGASCVEKSRDGDGSGSSRGVSGAVVCRLCAGVERTSLRPDLQPLVLKYIGVTISSDDILSKEICEICSNKINEFHRYVENCLTIQEKLANISKSSTLKHEIKEECETPEFNAFKADDSAKYVTAKIKNEVLLDEDLSSAYGDDALDFDCKGDDLTKNHRTKRKLKITRRKKNGVQKDDDQKKSDPNLKKYIIFTCYICQETYPNWFRLKSHISQVHKQIPKVKCMCGCIVKSKTAMYRHIAGHNDPSCFSCDQCSRITKTPEALVKHKLRHLIKTEQMYTCSACPKIFTSKENLKSHERVHIPLTERYNFPCHLCGNKFTTKSAVTGHIRSVHEKLKRYVCDVCGYACSTGGELVQHRAIHSDEKHFECNICSKRFKTSSNLKAHVDTHAITSYPCGVCGKVLNSRRTLRKHFLVHEDLCKHVCSFCKKAFKRRQTLKVHLTTHTGDRPIQCPWCPQKFAYSSVFRSHKQRVHIGKVISLVKNEDDTEENLPEDTKNDKL